MRLLPKANAVSPFIPRCLLTLLSSLCLASCGGSYAPKGWLPESEAATHWGKGAYVYTETENGQIVEGEALAAIPDTVFILTSSNPGLATPVPRAEIFFLKGEYYDIGSSPKEMSVITAIGSVVSIFSVGFYSALFVPLYLLAGLIDANATANKFRFSYYGSDKRAQQDFDWRTLSFYSRFPAALPARFSRVTQDVIRSLKE